MIFPKNSIYSNQLGVKSRLAPLKKAINTPKAKLKKIEIIKRRSENNSPPENGRLTPKDLENCTGFVSFRYGSVFLLVKLFSLSISKS